MDLLLSQCKIYTTEMSKKSKKKNDSETQDKKLKGNSVNLFFCAHIAKIRYSQKINP
jgi:hypothetical protein